MRSSAHTAERSPGNIGGILSHGRRTDTLHVDANAWQPASNVRKDDPQPTETTTLRVHNGGTASGSQDSWARLRGPPDAVSPMQAMVLMGSAGQPADSDFDFGADTDASPDDEATAF
eukprot:8964598-Pyramimonas_sp.AAC.1